MFRTAVEELVAWKDEHNRKPLIVRGARQVGKTWLIRHFGNLCFDNVIEINFDQYPEKSSLFVRNIAHSLQFIGIDSQQSIVPGKTLLFLDEIQSAPHILPILRYFYEERPDIHIVATGSLLDFVLEDHDFSMPVGRISYAYLGPMTFAEFLLALGEDGLHSLVNSSTNAMIPDALHIRLLEFMKLYWIVGGMPAAVQAYVVTGDLRLVQQEHHSIVQTYQDDFAKYQRRVDTHLLRLLFKKIPTVLGQKVMYSKLHRDASHQKVSKHLQLLAMARLVHFVHHSDSNGLPLGAEINLRDFKLLFLDIGLLSTMLQLPLHQISDLDELIFVNNGVMAEQFVGQQLLYRHGFRMVPELYYWRRQAKSSSAELDYVIEHQNSVLPVEVKAGKSGSLKSLHWFVAHKGCSEALRCNANQQKTETIHTVVGKHSVVYRMVSIPLYLAKG